ncbi:hypothetical protein NKDENANG_02156 [Candidatus Entotheonellaceae bacterium PAL068K]
MTPACILRSSTVGMPSGRCLPFGLGMKTRLTGFAFQGWYWDSSRTSLVRAAGVLTTTLSTPALTRPLLICVTRRTASSRLE